MSELYPKFGDVYYASLMTDGSVQGGTRPVLIAQNNTGNRFSPVVEVIPFTSKKKATYMPTHIQITAGPLNGLQRDSVIMAEQVRVIDKARLLSRIGALSHSELVEVGKARMRQSPFPVC